MEREKEDIKSLTGAKSLIMRLTKINSSELRCVVLMHCPDEYIKQERKWRKAVEEKQSIINK